MKEYIKPELKEIDIVVEGIYASGISGAEENYGRCLECGKELKPGNLKASHTGNCSLFPK